MQPCNRRSIDFFICTPPAVSLLLQCSSVMTRERKLDRIRTRVVQAVCSCCLHVVCFVVVYGSVPGGVCCEPRECRQRCSCNVFCVPQRCTISEKKDHVRVPGSDRQQLCHRTRYRVTMSEHCRSNSGHLGLLSQERPVYIHSWCGKMLCCTAVSYRPVDHDHVSQHNMYCTSRRPLIRP